MTPIVDVGELDRLTKAAARADALEADLRVALAAIEDVMGSDKGFREDEWVDWCNQHLPLVQKYGRMRGVVAWG